MTPTIRPTIDGLRVRETAPDGKPIGQVYIRDTLTVLEPVADVRAKLGVIGQWLRVRQPDGAEGFVAAWFVEAVHLPEATTPLRPSPVDTTPTEPRPGSTTPAAVTPQAAPERLYVRPMQDGLRLREMPVDGTPIGIVGTSATLEALETASDTRAKVGVMGQWLKVRASDGRPAYLAAWLVTLVDPALVAPPVTLSGTTNILGVNLDLFHPLGQPDPSLLGELGWVRFGYSVSMGRGSQDISAAYNLYHPALERYARAGKRVLLVFTHQTYGEGVNEFWPWTSMTDDKWRRLTERFADRLHRIARQYAGQGIVHAYQVWNEMDAPTGAAASVPMSPRNYAHLLAESIKALRSADPTVAIISGGHTRGPVDGAAYARDTIRFMPVDIRPDGIATHPYGRGPNAFTRYANWGHIEDELSAYSAVLPGRPIWLTEWGCLDKEGDAPAQIARYAEEVIAYINERYRGRVAGAMWYAWAMGMHNGYGLVGRDGQPLRPLYNRFLALRG